MLGVAAGDRVVLELAEVPGEGDVLGAGDVLVAEEQHLVLEQQGADLGHEVGVARGVAEVHVRDSAPMAQVSGSTLIAESRAVLETRAGAPGFDTASVTAVIYSPPIAPVASYLGVPRPCRPASWQESVSRRRARRPPTCRGGRLPG